MSILDNVRLRRTPFTNHVEFISVNKKGMVINKRILTEDEIYEYLVELIKYVNDKGVDTLTNAETGEVWTFGAAGKTAQKGGQDMKAIIQSLSPAVCERIANGEQSIIVAKTAPKEVPFKVYIYQTKKHWIYKLLPWLKKDKQRKEYLSDVR